MLIVIFITLIVLYHASSLAFVKKHLLLLTPVINLVVQSSRWCPLSPASDEKQKKHPFPFSNTLAKLSTVIEIKISSKVDMRTEIRAGVNKGARVQHVHVQCA